MGRLIAAAPPSLRPCVLFEDEARFGRISTLRSCWAPPGVRPHVGHQQVREYRDAVLAVAPSEGRIGALVIGGGFDHEAMGALLAQVRARFPRQYYLMFLDGAGAHISQDLPKLPDMHLELLPPYSPELNPVEPVWDYLREHYFANRVFPSLGRVDAQLCAVFRDLDAKPELVRSITLFDWIKAAKLT